ncbi:Hypothetical_protein [Hexamita inflata]|uniref:Hypothetical_protein n=1 Tax=Hexamita inflata TaxID=28002 RepID=A0AA86P933_9EUKA|nr:Hypothetical protein HINF_LOCUS20816 [Hexamita inflata]
MLYFQQLFYLQTSSSNQSFKLVRFLSNTFLESSSCREINAAASCKPIYTGIHLRRTNFQEAMERLPLSNPEGSLIAAQHFEPRDLTFRRQVFGRAASQGVECGEEREAQPYERNRMNRSHQTKLVFQQCLFSSDVGRRVKSLSLQILQCIVYFQKQVSQIMNSKL